MIPVFLPSDNNYAPYLATMMASILDNTKSFIDFYILDSGISEENRGKISALKNIFSNFNLEFLKIDLKSDFPEFKTNGYLNNSTYNRFLISKLKPELKKVIYLDSDMIVNTDISDLYDINLEGNIIGAVYDWNIIKLNEKKFATIGINQDDKYFNPGTLLIDNQKWIEENITDRLFELEKEYRDRLFYADMDLLNIYFKNNYKILPEKYNILVHIGAVKKDFNDTIVHFNGSVKPWIINEKADSPFIPESYRLFWKYLKMTEFYKEVFEKTLDEKEQKQNLRNLQLVNIVFKNQVLKQNPELCEIR